MDELQLIPSGGAMLKSMLIGFLLGFLVTGAALGAIPISPLDETFAPN